MDKIYKASGLDALLCLPPHENAMNTVDYSLCVQQHRRWAEAFLGVAQLQARRAVVTAPQFSVFSRTNSVMSMTYSYDRATKIEGV